MSGRAVVYGGRGALGSAIVDKFKGCGWWVASVDLKSCDAADCNILVTGESWQEQQDCVLAGLVEALPSDTKLDAVLCVAGGWAGGSPASQDFVKNSELMWRSSVWPASITATVATSLLRQGGLVVLPGAAPATAGTPTMAGYGMAKAAVHQLTLSLAMQGSGLPEDSTVAAILPVTLDTPMNRKWMAKADKSSWTPLEFVSDLLHCWASQPGERPQSGSLVKLVTQGGDTKLEIV